jgi:hypothetical protein
MSESRFQPRRYLGLELAGAKNPKTTLAVLEHYPKEHKTFLLEIRDKIGPEDGQTGDEALVDTILEAMKDSPHPTAKMGVNVPLELPPCIECTKKTCPLPSRCTVPAVKWMRESVKRAARAPVSLRVKDFTPYTQRPIELWLRYHVLAELPERLRFEIDETLGGNKAPLTARMHFLKRHLGKLEIVETSPKLTVARLMSPIKHSHRLISAYRRLEEGAYARSEIIEQLAGNLGVFIYEKDARTLAHSLSAFDAFLCAYGAVLSDHDLCEKPPKGFPVSSGWVHYPE